MRSRMDVAPDSMGKGFSGLILDLKEVRTIDMKVGFLSFLFFFSSRRRHTRCLSDWSSDVCSSDLSFTEETTQQFDDAIAKLRREGLKSLVLDLRFNGGGVLESAAEIANRFLRSGTIYEQRGRKATARYEARPERATIAGIPTVVLVNGDTASASEVLSAALSEHGAAAIVGERTYGKGVVQSLRRFDDNGAYIKITTAYYFTPTGRNLERAREEDRNDTRAGGIAP